MNKKGELTNLSKAIIALFVVAIVLYAGWYFFMSYVDCDDRDCFDANMAECIRSKYVGGTEMVYEIKEKAKDIYGSIESRIRVDWNQIGAIVLSNLTHQGESK